MHVRVFAGVDPTQTMLIDLNRGTAVSESLYAHLCVCYWICGRPMP